MTVSNRRFYEIISVYYRHAISICDEYITYEGTYECNLGYVKIEPTAYKLHHSKNKLPT